MAQPWMKPLRTPAGQAGALAAWMLAGYVFLRFNSRSSLGLIILLSVLLFAHFSRLPAWAKVAFSLTQLLVVIPAVGMSNPFFLAVLVQAGIYVNLALGLNVVVGQAGLLDLGYVAFYAAGAYLYAIFASPQAANFISPEFASFPLGGVWFWPFIALALGVAAVVGVLLGLPVLRVKGDYLAIVTLGFGEIVRILMNNLNKPVNITNGPQGITPIQAPVLFGVKLNQPIHYYFIILALTALVLFAVRRIEHSRIGRAWAAVREDEIAARAMGVPLVRAKLLAFATGASFAGAMGVVFAAKQVYIDPVSFTFMESIGVLSMIIVGGLGSVPGVITGAVLVTVLRLQLLKGLSAYLNQLRLAGVLNLPTQLDPARYERFVFGIILVLTSIFRNQGLIPAVRPRIERPAGAPGTQAPVPARPERRVEEA